MAPNERVALPPAFVALLGVLFEILAMKIGEGSRIAFGAPVGRRVTAFCDRKHDLAGHNAGFSEPDHPDITQVKPARSASA
jgi:hypothetical protein